MNRTLINSDDWTIKFGIALSSSSIIIGLLLNIVLLILIKDNIFNSRIQNSQYYTILLNFIICDFLMIFLSNPLTLALLCLKLFSNYNKWLCMFRSLSIEISLFSCAIFLATLNFQRKATFDNFKLFKSSFHLKVFITSIWILNILLAVSIGIEFVLSGDHFTCFIIKGGKSQYISIGSKIVGFLSVLVSALYCLPCLYKNARKIETNINHFSANNNVVNRINLEKKAFNILICFFIEFFVFWLPVLIVRIANSIIQNKNKGNTLMEDLTIITTLMNLCICCVHPLTILKLSKF